MGEGGREEEEEAADLAGGPDVDGRGGEDGVVEAVRGEDEVQDGLL